jgi:hypothetical protein
VPNFALAQQPNNVFHSPVNVDPPRDPTSPRPWTQSIVQGLDPPADYIS